MRFLQFSIFANQAKVASSSRLPLQCSVRNFSTSPYSRNVSPVPEGGKEDSLQNEDVPKLLRLPRAALDPSIYFSKVSGPRNYQGKSFRIVLRPIDAKVTKRINDGPKYLSGSYPMGLLKQKHEKRRFLDPGIKPFSGWRDFLGEAQNPYFESQDKGYHFSYKQSALIKRPLLVKRQLVNASIAFTPLHTYIPVLVVTGKKTIDNRAVVRNKAKTKILHAFQEGLKLHQNGSNKIALKWPLTDEGGDPLGLVFYPSKETIQEPMQDLVKSCSKVLAAISVQYKQNPTFSKDPSHHSNNMKLLNAHRKSLERFIKGNKRDPGTSSGKGHHSEGSTIPNLAAKSASEA
ncbi:uncharacterized protein FA14DRAFT_187126 [Meira miltonrushii]|uniref:Uncharacterized protein n=1 Tax=Meira miltonrushii TaxID=1280837 RepID=A0A316VH67_9BASI|nr:uncharacterized protein FA14DRAFT_187126 [Meira miltonrushii]PWN36989.1 hypothetical protein FA14DRAFT_187126 [Meira miltonrushii]